jgi:YD repeat-containing protein
MRSRRRFSLAMALLVTLFPAIGTAQTTATYHLHSEASDIDTGAGQLRTSAPDAAIASYQTIDLKNVSTGDVHLRFFYTQANVPNVAGVIPAGSPVSFTMYAKKTSNWGAIVLRATARVANIGIGASDLCTATAGSALTTTISAFTFTCTTATAVTISPSSRFDVRVFFTLTTSPGNHSMRAELDIEGTLNGNYDSRVTYPLPPPPSVSSVSPTSAPANAPVQITGTNFGSNPGDGTVRFNGVAATVTSWSATSITAAVPATAASGPVTVSLGSATSNGVAFTVIPPPSISGLSAASGAVGESITISGSNFLSTQGSSTVKFNGLPAVVSSWANGSITATVPYNATTGPVVVTVFGASSTGSTFTVTKGAIGGTITAAAGGAPLQGATIEAIQGDVKASVTSSASGTYSMPNLDGGPYVVRVVLSGYATELISGAQVTGNTTTTVNAALTQPGGVSGRITEANGVTPIAGASISLVADGASQATVSADANGDYAISGLHSGSYTLVAAAVGYVTEEVGVSVPQGAAATADVSLDAATPTPISYAYDELGRLISVVDPSGDAADFRYDAVGNLLSIVRHSSSATAVAGFAPTSGPVGAVVTISGTGFSTTPTQNSVTIGGAGATVSAATATQLVVTVPSGLPTGNATIAVTSPSGNATASTPFAVTTSTAPTISGFSPSVAVRGSAVTINGTNFETTLSQNSLLFNIAWAPPTGGSATTLNALVPTTGTSGPISVSTVKGTAVSSADLFVPPATYTAADVEYTARMSIGQSHSVPTTVGGKIALIVFSAAAGQRVSILHDQIVGQARGLKLYGADGSDMIGTIFGGGLLTTVTLPIKGTYTLFLGPGNAGESARVTVFNAPEITGSLLVNAAATPLNFEVPGQAARFTFAGSANQQVTVRITNNALALWPGFTFQNHCTFVSLLRGTTTLTSANRCDPSFTLPTQTLPANDTYTVLVDPLRENYGTLDLQVTSP